MRMEASPSPNTVYHLILDRSFLSKFPLKGADLQRFKIQRGFIPLKAGHRNGDLRIWFAANRNAGKLDEIEVALLGTGNDHDLSLFNYLSTVITEADELNAARHVIHIFWRLVTPA